METEGNDERRRLLPVKSVLTDDKSKLKGENIDARGINILDDNGHQVLYIDATGIHWTPQYSPFKTQYSVSATGPWHETYAANDEYRRDSTDGGITWGPGIKYVAKDGRNGVDGSDANVPEYIKLKGIDFTNITETSVESPTILGGVIKGADIYGGSFQDLSGRGKLTLAAAGGRYADLTYSSTSGYDLFKVYDDIPVASMFLGSQRCLYHNYANKPKHLLCRLTLDVFISP